jgi:hypothetical protein
MDSVVKFSAVWPFANAAYARLGTGQRTIKGWHTAVDLLITSNGFGTPRYRTWPMVAVRCKVANCSIKAVKGTQCKFE